MRKIGFDLDGTISKIGFYNPSLKLPWWLFIFLIPIIIVIRPDKEAVRRVREMKDEGHKIIIISARPSWATALTKRWLIYHRVPFDKILCVGFGKGTKKRKLQAVREEGIEYFFDDNRKLLEFFRRHSVKAAHL